MNHALTPIAIVDEALWAKSDEMMRLRRLRSLLALFSLYAAALLAVVVLSDGADVGCVLAGIAGHVLYATHRMLSAWREASWLEHARDRALARRLRFA